MTLLPLHIVAGLTAIVAGLVLVVSGSSSRRP